MDSIDFLEHGGAGDVARFGVLLDGESYWMPDPREQHYQVVLTALHLGHVPGTPDCKEWQRHLIFERWRAAWDLPPAGDAKRLAYLVDHYRSAITSDLLTYAHLDLGTLWRARRWATLLDVIDRLPPHSWYAATVAQDEEHARMMAESLAARKAERDDGETRGPALTSWTPEVAVLTSVLDAVRGVQHAVYAAQHGKKAGEPPKPMPRPITALEKAMRRAEFERRKREHEALVARLLPHKGAVKGQSQTPVH